jgi:hypothetical protein
MPDNKQIDKTLEYAIGHSPVSVDKLSPEGRVLIDDTRDILETLRMIVQEKNADELFQNAVWASYAGDPSRARQDGVAPVSKEDAKKDVDQGEPAVASVVCNAKPSRRALASAHHPLHYQLRVPKDPQ